MRPSRVANDWFGVGSTLGLMWKMQRSPQWTASAFGGLALDGRIHHGYCIFSKDVGLVILSWIQFLFDCTNIVHTIFGRH